MKGARKFFFAKVAELPNGYRWCARLCCVMGIEAKVCNKEETMGFVIGVLVIVVLVLVIMRLK